MPSAPPDIQNGWDDDRGYNPPDKQQSFDGWDDDFDEDDDDRSSTSTGGVPQHQQVGFFVPSTLTVLKSKGLAER